MGASTHQPIDPRIAEEILINDMTAEGLRRFCTRNNITRPHGAMKRETVVEIMSQNPDAAVQWLRAQGYEVVDGFSESAAST